MTNLACPQCGSGRVHRTHRQHPMERAVSILGAKIERCHECNGRYARFGHVYVPTTGIRRASERFALAIALFTTAALILVTILWFSRVQANPATETGQARVAGWNKTV